MKKIYNLFSDHEAAPSTHSVETANRLLPLIQKYTREAVIKSSALMARMESKPRESSEFQKLAKEYDRVVERWVERCHRLGAIAKGLWLVDFDTGTGYLCWSFPEAKVEHFHSYETGFKNRKKIV